MGPASDPLVERFGWSLGEIRFQWNWELDSAGPQRPGFQACLADMPDCFRCSSGLEETALHVFYYCERVHPFWSHVSPKQLVQHDVGYVVDNVDSPYQGEKRVVFLAILAEARMEIWETRNKDCMTVQTFLIVI